MKIAALALALLAACSVSASPPAGQRVRYTASFAAGTARTQLEKVVEAYAQRLGKSASEVRFSIDEQAATIRAEMPFAAAFHESKPGATLAEALAADPLAVAFTTTESVPLRALAHVDEEWLRYDAKGGERGLFGTPVAAHAAGAKLQLFEDDLVRLLLGAYGKLEFLEQPTKEFLAAHDASLEGEQARFTAWREAHPAAALEDYDTLERSAGGPLPGTLWRRTRNGGGHVLLARPAAARFHFGSADLAETGYSQDSLGYPAVSFELAQERQRDFGEWTEQLLGKGLAIVLDEEILVLATVRSRLPGSGIIEGGTGGFSKGEVQALVELLRMPLLPQRPLGLRSEFLR